MNEKTYLILKRILCILLILLFGIVFIRPIFQNDLFFDLKTGEGILKYGIDFKDHFSFIPNLTYIYHHWLYDLIIFGIYKLFSWDGLFLFFLFLFSVFGFVVFYVNKQNNGRVLSCFVALYTMFITSFSFQSRVQSITYILFFLEIYFLEKLYKTGSKKYSLLLLLISIFIVNLHMPIWILCIILCLPYIAEAICSLLSKKLSWLKKICNIEPPKDYKVLLITFGVLIISGLISPLKFYPYTFFTKSLFNGDYSFIMEMGSTELTYKIYLSVMLFACLIFYVFKIFKLELRYIFLILGLSVFSILAPRNIVFITMTLPTVFFRGLDIEKIKINEVSNIIKKINFKIVTVVLLVLVMFSCAYFGYNLYKTRGDYGITDEYPDKTVAYLKENYDYKNLKIYNDFNFGSYLEFNDVPVFIDSRAEVYIKAFNGGRDIVADYLDSVDLDKYKKVFKKYKFDLAIAPIDNIVYSILASDSNYKIVYTEEDSKIYALFETNFYNSTK